MSTPPASRECHAIMSKILPGLKGIILIKDDILVHGEGNQHDTNLEACLKHLQKEKCKLGNQVVNLWHSNKGAPYSDIIAPLRALTRLHARFNWTRECHNILDELKGRISHKTVLVLYMMHPETWHYVDHGSEGIV